MKHDYQIKVIALIGAGTMGTTIAKVLASAGKTVQVWEPVADNRVKANQRLVAGLHTAVEKGKMSREAADETLKRIVFASSLKEAVAGTQLIVEAVFEKAEVKRAFYEELLPLVQKDVIVASNTSALNVFELVPEELLPHQLITHWYAPADIVPLVEVVKSEAAPQWMADAVIELLRDAGKAPVQMKKFVQGYIVNRIQMCISREIYPLLDNGYCTPEDIDNAVKMSFAPRAMVLGICKKLDVSGTDVSIFNYRNNMPEGTPVPKCLQKMEEEQAFGVKSGKGFYDYTGVDMDYMQEHMDEQLEDAFALAKQFMKDPV